MDNLIKQIKKARFIWVCGNGGSAATAEHFTTDLFKKGFRAICLNSNTAIMTMTANDYGYEYVFADQLKRYGEPEDLLITISCSGTSKNIKEAIADALGIEMDIFEFETFGEEKDYGLLEDKHLKFAHEVAAKL